MPSQRDHGRDPRVHCPEAAYGEHGRTDRHGRCPYCGRKVDPVQPKPTGYRGMARSFLGDAYRRFWDPDWGSGPYDQDPL